MKPLTMVPFFLPIVSLYGGCANPEMLRPSADQQAYLDKVALSPLEFSVPNAGATDAWVRAQTFLSRYSSPKVQVGQDHIIQYYDPSMLGISFGYNVTKALQKDSVHFTVECVTGNTYKARDALVNAHILANYMQNGDLSHPELIKR